MTSLDAPAERPLAHSVRDDGLRHSLIGLAILWLLLAFVPLFAANDYIVSLSVTFLINLILIASLNTLIGYSGQISLSHSGFFGLGAYTSGIISAKLGISAWIGLPVACIIAAVAALIIGIPALRLRGHYLAMATLGFNAILTVLFNQLVGWTGGPNGLLGVKPFIFFGIPLDTQAAFFPLAWVSAGLVMWFLLNLIHSRTGRALRAIASSEIAANSLGVNPFRYKLIVFVLTAAMAGFAGSLYVHSNQYASPETFGFSASVLLVAMVALGGWGRYWGAFYGAAIFTAVPELLRNLHDAELLVFGAGMILVLMFFPGGIAASVEKLSRFARQRFS